MTSTPRRLPTLLAIAAAAALATACGPASDTATVNDLRSATPTSASVNLDIAGATPVTTATPLAAMAPAMPGADAVMVGDLCHPHLFSRTAEVVGRLNAVFYRHLRHVEAAIARHPDFAAGASATWTQTGSAVEVQRMYTIERSADGSTYTFELDLAPAGQTPPSWTKVFWGTLTRSATATVRTETAAMTFDYDALHGVLPAELLTGQVVVDWTRLVDSTKPAPGLKRTTTVTFDGFSFGPNDPHGPRTGTYSHVGEPGVGGSLSFQDSLVLLCPANPTLLDADTVTHSRWYLASGAVHGRADAKATGGQIPAADTWMGVTCYQGAVDHMPASTDEASFYWAMKLEDGTGATVAGSTHQVGAGATACDPAFGAVMSLDSNATDYGFPAGPVSFPNEW